MLDAELYQNASWSEDDVLNLSCKFECEHPNKDLLSFRGRALLDGPGTSGRQQPIQMSQLLLRGCKLKNSRHVLAVVVYTGRETRIQMNSAAAPRKIGAFDYFLDTQVFMLIALQLLVCAASAAGSYAWREHEVRQATRSKWLLGGVVDKRAAQYLSPSS